MGFWSHVTDGRAKHRPAEPWATARDAAHDLLAGQISGAQFLAAMHDLGREGPQELQDLVELDDEYLFGNDPTASQRFAEDQAM